MKFLSYNRGMQKKDKRLIFPEYTRTQVKNAGNRIRANSLTDHDEKIIENWRSSHNHILNTWFVTLVHRIERVDFPIFLGQRLKRKNTIYDKLRRPKTQSMSLERMYDIAGCRMVFENMDDLYNFRDSMLTETRFGHKRIKKHHKDYVEKAKDSGYRGIHDIYSYKGDPRRNRIRSAISRKEPWDGLFIEIQYRTKYQHAWATAVEVADIIKKSRTKFSDDADAEQNQFFKYASEIISRVYEGYRSCHSSLSDEELVNGFNEIEQRINLLQILKSVKVIKTNISDKDKKAIIIHLHIKDFVPDIEIRSFKSTNEASKKLLELEKKFPADDIVLVKSDKISSIRNIFRNYFTDAEDFVKYIEDGLVALCEGRVLFETVPKQVRRPKQLTLFDA